MSILTLHPDAGALDAVRVVLIVILAVAQAAMAFWPDLRGWTHTISSRSADLTNPVVPVPPAFAIWGLIFLSCAAFAVWQALPANLGDPLLRSLGWVAMALFAGNVLWEAWVPRHGLDWTSVAIIAAELGLALWLLLAVSAGDLDGWAWWLVAFPFQLFAGWVSAAFFVNLSSTLVRPYAGTPLAATGPNPRRPAVALALVGCAIVLGLVVSLLSGAWSYALAVAWALGGIALANRPRPTLAGTALAGAAAVIVASLVSPAAAQAQAQAQAQALPEDRPVTTIATPSLDIAYLERGPADGPVVIFIHGFPDDATAWLPVMGALAAEGVRSLAPFLRGTGPTTFRDDATPRSGQVAALVADLRAFMDAMDVATATLVGQDWGRARRAGRRGAPPRACGPPRHLRRLRDRVRRGRPAPALRGPADALVPAPAQHALCRGYPARRRRGLRAALVVDLVARVGRGRSRRGARLCRTVVREPRLRAGRAVGLLLHGAGLRRGAGRTGDGAGRGAPGDGTDDDHPGRAGPAGDAGRVRRRRGQVHVHRGVGHASRCGALRAPREPGGADRGAAGRQVRKAAPV